MTAAEAHQRHLQERQHDTVEALALIAAGLTRRAVARRFGCSEKALAGRIHRLQQRKGCLSVTHLIVTCIHEGLLTEAHVAAAAGRRARVEGHGEGDG